jgi:hypothetical protein
MAFCPKCKAIIGQTAIRCTECGYDFPDEPKRSFWSDFAYSRFADFSLKFGAFFAGFACFCVAPVNGFVAALDGNIDAFGEQLVIFVVSFLAMLVLIRIQNK